MNLKKDLALIGGLFLLVAVLLIFGGGFTSVGQLSRGRQATESASIAQRQIEEGKTRVKVRNLDIVAEIAASDKDKKKGLADRDSLAISEGMLFVYDKSGIYTFWMKDVKFPIDIVWISRDKKIVDIVSSAEPEPDKDDEDLKRYRPDGESQYILEINAGLAGANGLAIGDEVNFDL